MWSARARWRPDFVVRTGRQHRRCRHCEQRCLVACCHLRGTLLRRRAVFGTERRVGAAHLSPNALAFSSPFSSVLGPRVRFGSACSDRVRAHAEASGAHIVTADGRPTRIRICFRIKFITDMGRCDRISEAQDPTVIFGPRGVWATYTSRRRFRPAPGFWFVRLIVLGALPRSFCAAASVGRPVAPFLQRI